ncbi:MAG: tetratricopeptide repeat protein, partial [Planctomycetota bacterium]|nr:tetratricopeptide repeat protein [Planctomycetota bacterium]
SQVSTDVHIGLGGPPAEQVDAIEVRWKDGTLQRSEAVEAQRLVIIRRGPESPEGRDLPRWSAPSDPGGRPARAWVSDLVRVTRTPSALSLPPGTPMVVRVHADPPPAPPLGATVDGSPGVSFVGVRVVDAYLRTGDPAEGDLDGRSAVLLEPELFAEALGAGPTATIVTRDDGAPLRIFRGPTRPADVQAFCELGRHEPAHRHLLLEHGRLAVEEARYRDGAALFERATRDDATLRAQHAYAFEGLGRAYVLLGRLDLAESAYRRAVGLDPDYAAGWFNLAATFSQQGRFTEALPALAEVRRIEGDTRRVLGSLAEARSGDGDLEGASAAAEQWLRSAPADVAMLILAGKLRARRSDWEAAIPLLERAARIDPGNAEARAALTEARRRR